MTAGNIRPRSVRPSSPATAANPLALVSIAPTGGGDPVGAGLIVPAPESSASVLTCAHVVAAAGGAPDGQVTVTPWADHSRPIPARVRPDGWFPIDDQGRGDIAVLEPLGEWPDRVAFAALAEWSGRDRSRWQAFGYPTRYKQVGQHASGRFVGRFGPGNEWVQIDAEVVVGYRIVPGYSGSPVWEVDRNVVVGLAVSEDAANPAARSGGMLPIEVIASYWEPLASLVRRQSHPQALAVDRSWLRTAGYHPPPPSSLGFTITNILDEVVKVVGIRCRVLERAKMRYDALILGIPDRYELTLTLDDDHDEYELLDRHHILRPQETEEYAVTIDARDSGKKYRLAMEVSWRRVGSGQEGVAMLDPFWVNH